MDNKQLVRRYIEEIWGQGNLEAIEELCAPTFEARDPLVGSFPREAMPEAVKAYRSAFPDLKIEIVNLLAEGNKTSARWIGRGTNLGSFMGMPPTGRKVVVSGIYVCEVHNGQVTRDFNEYDAPALLRQLGVDPKSVMPPAVKR